MPLLVLLFVLLLGYLLLLASTFSPSTAHLLLHFVPSSLVLPFWRVASRAAWRKELLLLTSPELLREKPILSRLWSPSPLWIMMLCHLKLCQQFHPKTLNCLASFLGSRLRCLVAHLSVRWRRLGARPLFLVPEFCHVAAPAAPLLA